MSKFRHNGDPRVWVAVSGGFDPLHAGPLAYLQEARTLGDALVVILNGDSFLVRKKGAFVFSSADRAKLLRELKCVDDVFVFDSEQDTVIPALDFLRPDIFAKGGDRTGPENIPEWEFCQKNNIQVITGVGGSDKKDSSSRIVRKSS